MRKMHKYISNIAKRTSSLAGHPRSLVIAFIIVLMWSVSGPFFNFSETWQLVINTFTTIITFLLALSIQHTQNRDSKTIHLKLNELLRHTDDLQEALDRIEKELDEEE